MGEAHASERDPDGFRMVKFPGGNYVHINHGTCGAEIHVTGGLTTDVAEFIFRLGLASGMLVTSTIDPNIAAVLPGQSHFCITGRWPDAAHVGSVRDLMNWVGRMVAEDRLASE